MKGFERMVAGFERETREDISKEIKDFKLALYRNPLQHFVLFIFSLLPKTQSKKNALRETNESILKIVREYCPLISEQYRQYYHYFNMWECCNNANGYDRQAQASQGEAQALREIERLTTELQGNLDELGWEYNPIPERNELVRGYNGYINISKALKYFKLLEKHFEKI